MQTCKKKAERLKEEQTTDMDFSSINTYEMTLSSLGIVSLDTPKTINIYPKDFDSKEEITSIIDKYKN